MAGKGFCTGLLYWGSPLYAIGYRMVVVDTSDWEDSGCRAGVLWLGRYECVSDWIRGSAFCGSKSSTSTRSNIWL